MEQTIPDTIRVGVLTKAHTLDIVTLPMPKMGDEDVLVKQEASNICTTDYTQWQGKREHQGYPMAGGHEGSGIVVAKGAKAGDELRIGDRVALTYAYCGRCKPCRLGQQIECVEKFNLVSYFHQSELGYYGTYGFATYMVRPSKYLIRMNRDMDAAEAGFLEPVATVVNGIRKLRVAPMETVVVIGAGTMGLLNAQVARAYGARVLVSEMLENKLQCARDMGFVTINPSMENVAEKVRELTGGLGADAVIVAVGATKANEQALEMVKALDGRVLFFAASYPKPELNIDSNLIHYRKFELIGAFEANQRDFFDAATLLNNGHIAVAPLIRGRYPLDEIEKAFEAASVPGSYRIALELS
ncbi:MAG: alcohol dehydrogenase catalytic domain-containing protein [Planctomycetes bacterium]|nr:alcohol dehydrogenase catalytic domain-containing protein [Planctomycetota bacterium]